MGPRNASPNPDLNQETRHAGHFVLDEIQQSEHLPATLSPEEAFTAVMCTLRQALRDDAIARLERGLPLSIRTLAQRCPAHGKNDALRPEHVGEFVGRVGAHLDMAESEAEELTRVVFHAVHRLMSVGEVQDVASALPDDLRDLWCTGDSDGDPVEASRSDLRADRASEHA